MWFFFLLVARCQSDEAVENAGEVSDIGIVGDETDDAQEFADGGFPSAPGIDTAVVFPKNNAKCKDLYV
jgi:translocon-associated protein subunit alpha